LLYNYYWPFNNSSEKGDATIMQLIKTKIQLKMKKKDLLLESFDTKLQKTELKSIYGGLVEITQFTENTPVPGGNTSDKRTDQR